MVNSIHRLLLFLALFALSCTNDNRGANTPADGVSLSGGLAGETTHDNLSTASPESSATDFAVSSQYLASAAERLLVSVDESEQVTFIHQNHLGSNTLLSDSTGQEKGRWAYTPYGSLRSATGQAPVYGFSNQEKDLSTELLHFKYRYLDATNGRWLQADPLYIISTSERMEEHGEATTAYAYVGNHAINSFDPLGLNGDNKSQMKFKKSLRSDGPSKHKLRKTKAKGPCFAACRKAKAAAKKAKNAVPAPGEAGSFDAIVGEAISGPPKGGGPSASIAKKSTPKLNRTKVKAVAKLNKGKEIAQVKKREMKVVDWSPLASALSASTQTAVQDNSVPTPASIVRQTPIARQNTPQKQTSSSRTYRPAPQPRKRLYFELETFKKILGNDTKWGGIGFKTDTN